MPKENEFAVSIRIEEKTDASLSDAVKEMPGVYKNRVANMILKKFLELDLTEYEEVILRNIREGF